MAHLVRPVITSYTLGGKRVPKGTRGAKKVRARAAKWYRQGIPGLPRKKRMLAEIVGKAERDVHAHPDPDEASRPLAPLVEEFRA